MVCFQRKKTKKKSSFGTLKARFKLTTSAYYEHPALLLQPHKHDLIWPDKFSYFIIAFWHETIQHNNFNSFLRQLSDLLQFSWRFWIFLEVILNLFEIVRSLWVLTSVWKGKKKKEQKKISLPWEGLLLMTTRLPLFERAALGVLGWETCSKTTEKLKKKKKERVLLVAVRDASDGRSLIFWHHFKFHWLIWFFVFSWGTVARWNLLELQDTHLKTFG